MPFILKSYADLEPLCRNATTIQMAHENVASAAAEWVANVVGIARQSTRDAR